MNYEYAGKWKWNMYDDGNLVAVVEANQGGQLDKYAALIAAAPDMLEALEEAVRLIEPIASALEDHGYDNAEAANVFFALGRAICAIAKARGAHEPSRT
jgi:hypothetical protein